MPHKQEIHSAYRQLAKKYHPDRHKTSSSEIKSEAAVQYAAISKARDTLITRMRLQLLLQAIDISKFEKISPAIDFISPDTRELVREKIRGLAKTELDYSEAIEEKGLLTLNGRINIANPLLIDQIFRQSGIDMYAFAEAFYDARENTADLDPDNHRYMENLFLHIA